MKYLLVAAIVGVLATVIIAESCIKCNSKDEERCATDPLQLLPSTCNNATSACYMRVVDKHTSRGCTDELDAALVLQCFNSTDYCDQCFGINQVGGCNNGLIPNHRPTCHQCEGKLNESCALAQLLIANPCPLYDVDDKCFIRKSTKADTFYRGCLSSAGKLCKNESHCYSCAGNGCNNLNAEHGDIPDAPGAAALKAICAALLYVMIALVLKI